jgi:hypothetical protein
MPKNTNLLRPFWALLAIMLIGRLAQTALDTPYEKGHHLFSIVTMTFIAAALTAAYARGLLGMSLKNAFILGLMMGFSAQVVIFLATMLSIVAGAQTYFNHPTALNFADPATPVTFGSAIGPRVGGLFIGSLIVGVVACIGWLIGGLMGRKE